MLCAGSEYTGSFQKCTFSSGGVYVVHGAAVTLLECRIDSCQPAVTVTGDATSATLIKCTLSNNLTGVVVDGGAVFAAESCHIEQSRAPLIVNDAGSHATMADCTIDGATRADVVPGEALVTARDGSVLLQRCSITRFHFTVQALGPATRFEGHHLTIRKSLSLGFLSARVRALFRDTELDMSRKGHPVERALGIGLGSLRGSGGGVRLQLERCLMHGDVMRGIAVEDGSSVSAHLCRFNSGGHVLSTGRDGGRVAVSHCSGYGKQLCFWIGGGSPARVKGGDYSSEGSVFVVAEAARAQLVQCTMRGLSMEELVGVVSAHDGSVVHIRECDIRDGTAGVSAVKSTVYVTDTVVSDMRVAVPPRSQWGGAAGGPRKGGGGYMVHAGFLSIRRGRVHRCDKGIVVQGDLLNVLPVTLQVTGAVVEADLRGLIAESGCDVTVEGCEFLGPDCERTAPSAYDVDKPPEVPVGVSCDGMGGASLADCVVDGFWYGLRARMQKVVHLRDCSFWCAQKGYTGVWVVSSADLQGCKFQGWGGVEVEGDGTCALRRCQFLALQDTAVKASGTACVKLTDRNVMEGCARGLALHDRAAVGLQDCDIADADIAVGVHGGACTLSAKRVTARGANFGVLCDFAGRGTGSLKLVDSQLNCSVDALTVIGGVPEAVLLRCNLSGGSTGVHVLPGAALRLRESTVSECAKGVSVGVSRGDLMNGCDVCGLAGPEALAEARQALMKSGGRLHEDARCAHQGAVARLTMVNVTVSECGDTGVFVFPHGIVDASGVAVKRCGAGFLVHEIDERNTFTDCRAVACKAPVELWRTVSAHGGDPLLWGEHPGIVAVDEE